MAARDLETRVAAFDPEARAAALPCWSAPVTPRPLGGGITNANFLVEDAGRRYVVRVGGDIPVHHILRANDVAASRAAHLAGVSPAVFHAEADAVVIDYVEGRTFTLEDVRAPDNHPALIALVRRAHRDIPRHLRGPAAMFWVFHVLRDYARALDEGGSRHRPRLPGFLAEAEHLAAAIGPIDVVFGHNDLLAGNVIDDGRRLWLIDWDYAGFNSPLFDLGGLASNSSLDRAATEGLLELYFDRPVDDDLRRRAAAMRAASLLRETLWSMVSELHSPLPVDYDAYTTDNLARYGAAKMEFEALR